MDNVAYVVTSCLKYSDCWPVMMQSIKKNWPDIYDKVHILTEGAGDYFDQYNFILLPEDRSWSDNLIYVCEYLKKDYEYIFLTMEDGILIEPIDHKEVERYVSKFIEVKGTFFTLLNDPYPTGVQIGDLRKISLDSAYRPTTTAAFWSITKLLELLVSGESAWEFEKIGSNRTRQDDNYYALTDNKFPMFHLVVKGRIFRNAKKDLEKFGLIYEGTRKEMSLLESFKMNLYIMVHRIIFKLTPYKLQKYLVRK